MSLDLSSHLNCNIFDRRTNSFAFKSYNICWRNSDGGSLRTARKILMLWIKVQSSWALLENKKLRGFPPNTQVHFYLQLHLYYEPNHTSACKENWQSKERMHTFQLRKHQEIIRSHVRRLQNDQNVWPNLFQEELLHLTMLPSMWAWVNSLMGFQESKFRPRVAQPKWPCNPRENSHTQTTSPSMAFKPTQLVPINFLLLNCVMDWLIGFIDAVKSFSKILNAAQFLIRLLYVDDIITRDHRPHRPMANLSSGGCKMELVYWVEGRIWCYLWPSNS